MGSAAKVTVRPRKATGQPSFPLVPHIHTCRGCAERHRWICKDRHCTWSIHLECVTAAAEREHFNTDA